MSKPIIIASILSISIIAATLIISNKPTSETSNPIQPSSLGASITADSGDKQVIELTAKGGYSPTLLQASADKTTILRVKTFNTFDCSSALSIPSLGINRMLPATGNTDIEMPPQSAGTQIEGTCSMGMYRFSIKFI